jgi:PAS domain S-box-containing protein
MKNKIKILIIEDNEDDALLEVHELSKKGFEVVFERVDQLEDFVRVLNEKAWDCIISDYNLPGFSGIDALESYKKTETDIPFILVSGVIGEEKAVEAMKAGAHDYIMKENIAKLVPVIEREMREAQNRKEKRQAETVLKVKMEELRRMATVVRDSNDAVILHDFDGKILSWNYGAKVTYGYTEAEALNMNIRDLIARGDRPEAMALIQRIRHGEIVKSYELRRMTKDGRSLDMWVTSTLLTDEKGKPVSIATTERDITLRKRIETELINAKVKAEEGDRLKTAFLSNISHEIRTPVNAIVGFSYVLNDPELENDKREYFTDIIVQSSNHLLAIINDLVSISTIETGQEKTHESGVNLNSICRLVYEEFSSKARCQNVELRVKTELPDSNAIIITDDTKLIQILNNLVGNALKFTMKGYVEFGYKVMGGLLEFWVSDSGIGIPDEMHKEIFERFRQVDATNTHHYGGSGLGLSISKAYVELLGGKIWVDSEPEKGSVFSFTLPYKKVEMYDLPSVHSPKGLSQDVNQPKIVLVAEDEDINFMLLALLISKMGLNIIRAKNGVEAVEICRSDQHVDLVLMDIKMPIMNGFEATKILKELRPDLPVIAQTAYTSAVDKANAFACGCSDFISKPFKRDTLITKINEQLENNVHPPIISNPDEASVND